MAYPETNRITRPIRLSIFLFLVASFFIISPLLVAYTMGYRYNWQTRRVEQTGVISLDFEPRDAIMRLNGEIIDGESPLRIPNRTPGNYHVSIEKTGFQSWQKDITVSSKQTTYIKNINLFAQALPIPLFPDSNIDHLSASFDGSYLLMRLVSQGDASFILYDSRALTTTTLPVPQASSSSISWSPFSNTVAIASHHATSSMLMVISPASFLPERVESYDIAGTPDLRWADSLLTHTLYNREGATIYRLERNRKIRIGELPAPEWPWFVDQSGELWWYDPTTFQLVPSTNRTGAIAVNADAPMTRIVDINTNRAILQNDTNTIIFPRQSTEENQNHTIEYTSLTTFYARYNSATTEWLTWSPWELWSIYSDGRTVLLNRRSERIQDVVPLDRFGVELLTTPSSLEAFNPGYYINHTLWHGGNISAVAVNQRLKKIFFLGSIGDTTGVFELSY